MKGRRPLYSYREESADLRWKSLLFGGKPCERCGGLLTRDEELSVSIERKLPSLRCIQCGEWMDEVILRNRVMTGLREQQTGIRSYGRTCCLSARGYEGIQDSMEWGTDVSPIHSDRVQGAFPAE